MAINGPLRSQKLTGIALALAGRAGERLAALLDLTAERSSLLRRSDSEFVQTNVPAEATSGDHTQAEYGHYRGPGNPPR